MKRLLFIPLVALVYGNVYSQAASDVSTLLFSSVKSRLTSADKKAISGKLGFVLSGDKNQPFAQDKDSREFPFQAFVYPTDMNKDGKEEIFILFGNSYTSGSAGSSIVVFIKSATGVYEPNLGFPGTLPEMLSTTSQGYSDLLIGGPGFDFPVWRWNGKMYDHSKTVNEKTYNSLKKINIEEVSKTCQESLQ